MPYAIDNQISQAPIEGGVQISSKQYADALATLTSGGHVFVYEGQMILTYKPETQEGCFPPVWKDGDWYHEPRPEPEELEEEENE
jgi:hypothetical protein